MFKRFIVCVMVVIMCLQSVASAKVVDNLNVNSWKEDVDYMAEMIAILESDPTDTEYQLAEAYEALRNAKITNLGLEYATTSYFADYANAEEILYWINYVEPEPEVVPADDYDVDILARVLYLEAGSNWIPDWVIQYCGYVVVNRMNDSRWPGTVEGVLSQSGQFSTWSSRYRITPTERCYTIAREVLEGGSLIPENVVYFANFTQAAGVYETYYNPYGGNLYFCYG